jgi:hypothetical protein
MSHSPLREIRPLTKTTGRHVDAANSRWATFFAAVADTDPPAVAAYCAIGVLLALNLILRFPEFGAVIEQYNQF